MARNVNELEPQIHKTSSHAPQVSSSRDYYKIMTFHHHHIFWKSNTSYRESDPDYQKLLGLYTFKLYDFVQLVNSDSETRLQANSRYYVPKMNRIYAKQKDVSMMLAK